MPLDEGAEVAGSQRKFLSLVKSLWLRDRMSSARVAGCEVQAVPSECQADRELPFSLASIHCTLAAAQLFLLGSKPYAVYNGNKNFIILEFSFQPSNLLNEASA